MNRIICISGFILFMATTAKAQLIVNDNQKVAIGTSTEDFEPSLMVRDNCYFGTSANASIGAGATPYVKNDTNNIGVYGGFWVNPNFSQDSNFGVLGVVEQNTNHGRNYGLCGMIDPSISSYGGAGIYATDCDYCYIFPHDIYGIYAACFVGGSVHITGNLTTSNMFSISDRRLCHNIVSLSKSNRSGKTTLENLLNMNIVEYNLKGRQFEEVSGDVDLEKAEELRRELEFLKKEDKEMTSRRHFGVDARKLQKVYPGLVLEGQDGYLSVNYLEMVPLVIRSIQELKQELDELKDDEERESPY